jgi:hypothetical protein
MICYIAYDNLDKKLGEYFTDCADNCDKFIQEYLKIKPTLINGLRLSQANIDITLEHRTEQKFLFAAYSHGWTDALIANKMAYLKVGLNTKKFKGGLIYTNSCLAARELGYDLIDNGAYAFVGYSEEVPVIHEDSVKKIIKDADNYALLLFLNGIPIGKAVQKAREFLTDKILYLEELKSEYKFQLIDIRDAMEIIGNEELTISDLLSQHE